MFNPPQTPPVHRGGLRVEVFGFTEGCIAGALAEPQGGGLFFTWTGVERGGFWCSLYPTLYNLYQNGQRIIKASKAGDVLAEIFLFPYTSKHLSRRFFEPPNLSWGSAFRGS